MARLLAIALTALFVWSAAGQGAREPLAFEVASVKPLPGGLEPGRTGMAPPLEDGTSILRFSASLQGIFARAYDLLPADMSGPSWMQDRLYDIVARPPKVSNKQEIAAMLRNLLATRFKARVHWDNQEVSGYAITVGAGGPKLKPAAKGGGSNFGFMMGDPVTLTFRNATMGELARHLRVDMDKPVVDMTGIQGSFDLEITCSLDSLPGMRLPMSSPRDRAAATSIFTAIKDLGLNLEARKVEARTLVIDSVEKVPTEN